MKITDMPSSRCIFDQLQNLGLHSDVERSGGLVSDEEFRLGDERHRDHHPLAHASGKFMRG